MAVTTGTSFIRFSAAGDVDTRKLKIHTFIFSTGAVASASGDLITVKNGAGVAIFSVPMLAERSETIYAGGGYFTGIELDAAPAGARMTVILA